MGCGGIEYCLVSADGIVPDDPFPFREYQDDAYLRIGWASSRVESGCGVSLDRVDLHKPHDVRQLSGVSNPASEA
jgi:hypothetical protein